MSYSERCIQKDVLVCMFVYYQKACAAWQHRSQSHGRALQALQTQTAQTAAEPPFHHTAFLKNDGVKGVKPNSGSHLYACRYL